MNDWRNPWNGYGGPPPSRAQSYDDVPYPSLSRFSQSSSQNRQPPPSVIPGRLVNTPDEIRAQEIPMDGTLSLFPQRDLTCIHAYQWATDHVETVRYVPEIRQQKGSGITQADTDELKSALFDRLDKIEVTLTQLAAASTVGNGQKPNKKEEKASG